MEYRNRKDNRKPDAELDELNSKKRMKKNENAISDFAFPFFSALSREHEYEPEHGILRNHLLSAPLQFRGSSISSSAALFFFHFLSQIFFSVSRKSCAQSYLFPTYSGNMNCM